MEKELENQVKIILALPNRTFKVKVLEAMRVLVNDSQTLSKRKPLHFSSKDIIDYFPTGIFYKDTLKRELRWLKSNTDIGPVISYDMHDRLLGQYTLQLLDRKLKYNKVNLIEMLNFGILKVDELRKHNPSQEVQRLLNASRLGYLPSIFAEPKKA